MGRGLSVELPPAAVSMSEPLPASSPLPMPPPPPPQPHPLAGRPNCSTMGSCRSIRSSSTPTPTRRRRLALAVAATVLALSMPAAAAAASSHPRRIGGRLPSLFFAPPPPPSSSTRACPPPLYATNGPNNNNNKGSSKGKAAGGVPAAPPGGKARSGLGGVGLTREKALLGRYCPTFLSLPPTHPPTHFSHTKGAVGGSLGIWGIYTAAKNLQEAEISSVDNSFVWKSTNAPNVVKEELGGGLSGPGLSLTPQVRPHCRVCLVSTHPPTHPPFSHPPQPSTTSTTHSHLTHPPTSFLFHRVSSPWPLSPTSPASSSILTPPCSPGGAPRSSRPCPPTTAKVHAPFTHPPTHPPTHPTYPFTYRCIHIHLSMFTLFHPPTHPPTHPLQKKTQAPPNASAS